MKKNITINLFGQLYAIDEDAYELLSQYETNMRSYFSRREGGEEVADDVERRVAELFDELRAQGVMAITIEHVQDIIQRIGDPEQMAEEETVAGGESGHTGRHEKVPPYPGDDAKMSGERALFRHPTDRIGGGVIAGICAYFGWKDVTIWRLVFILLCIFTYAGFALVYLVFWLVVPEARTPEQRLRMRGESVNPNALNEEMMHGFQSSSVPPASMIKSSGETIGRVLIVVAGVGAIFGLLFCLVMILLVFLGALISLFFPSVFVEYFASYNDWQFLAFMAQAPWLGALYLLASSAGIIACVLFVAGIFRAITNRESKNGSLFLWGAVATVIAISCGLFGLWGTDVKAQEHWSAREMQMERERAQEDSLARVRFWAAKREEAKRLGIAVNPADTAVNVNADDAEVEETVSDIVNQVLGDSILTDSKGKDGITLEDALRYMRYAVRAAKELENLSQE